MSIFRVLSGRTLHSICPPASSNRISCSFRPNFQKYKSVQWRSQHNQPSRYQGRQRHSNPPPQQHQQYVNYPQYNQQTGRQVPIGTFIGEQVGPYVEGRLPPPYTRYLRPTFWAILASAGIFTGLAYLKAKEELGPKARTPSFSAAPQWTRGPPTPTEVATKALQNLDPMERLGAGIVGTNVAVHLGGFLVPGLWMKMWHTPYRNVNYSLFTSMWVHSGALHLIFNMYATWSFIRPVGYGPVFHGDTHHVLAFFMATGVLSGLAQHWATLIPKFVRQVPEVMIPCGGASGALLGLLSMFCIQYPHAGIGIIFVPYFIEAQYVLPLIMSFDLVGTIRGFKAINFGHAAHLAGATLGIVYTAVDGHGRVWRPLVDFWTRRLQAKR